VPAQNTSFTTGVDRSVGDPTATKTASTAAKTAITPHWRKNPPNIYLALEDEREDPLRLGLECTEEVYEFLHRQDTFNQPARFLRGIRSIFDEANEDYPYAELYLGRDRMARVARLMDRVVDRTANSVIEYNNREETRRAEWTKKVPGGTEQMWREHNEEAGGSILPFLFGPSIVNTQLGAESRQSRPSGASQRNSSRE
jgi:hypothetical protein